MAAPIGHKRWGGRQKGTPNKTTSLLQEKTQELKIDPFEILLYFAAGDWEALGYEAEKAITENGVKYTIEPSVRARCAAEACSYLYPKRKALEHVEPINPDPTGGPDLYLVKVKELHAQSKKERQGA